MTATPHLPNAIEHIATDALIPYARNSRTHSAEQVAQIAASIREFGFTNPVLIDEHNTLIAGHGRVMAAQRIGMAQVPCIRLTHLTDAQRRAYVIADNKLALNAGWDMATLAREIEDLMSEHFDVELLGFGDSDLAALLDEHSTEHESDSGGTGDEDAAPEPPVQPVTVLGDVWLMGKHRVMCGDSTSTDSVRRLIGGIACDMVVTDPPYGVSYADKNKSLNESGKGNRIQQEIENDHLKGKELESFFFGAFSAMNTAMRPGCPFYIFAPQGGEQMMMMMMMLQKAGLPVRHELIWVKNNHVLGRADYHYKHEPVLYGWKDGAGHPWYGERNKFSVWNVDKPSSSKLHPTMKPIELVQIPIENSSKAGAVVLDLFGGSGSTLIACEKTKRHARLMELDQKYCDVIVKRWQDFTGKQATLEATGQSFEAVAQQRLAV